MITLGQPVWKSDGTDELAAAYLRITGESYYSLHVVEREITDEGVFMHLDSGYTAWVCYTPGQEGAELFAPLIDDPAEPVPEDVGVLLARFVALDKQRRDLEQQLEAVKRDRGSIEGPLAEQMGLNGMQNASVDGLTVYIKRSPYVSKASTVETLTVCETLKKLGRDYMVAESYNAASLKSLVKEYRAEWAAMSEADRAACRTRTEDGIPLALSRLLNVGERISVETRLK